MGAPNLTPSKLQAIEPKHFPQSALEQELQTAAKTRPDLTALGQAQSAQALAVSAAKLSYGPRVSAYGNWENDHGSWILAGTTGWPESRSESTLFPSASGRNWRERRAAKRVSMRS